MQKFILIFFLWIIACIKLIGQDPCMSQPLFEGLTPLWRHVIVDSTMIGYPDPDPNTNFVYSGNDHLEFDIGSFVKGDFLYGVTQINLTGDIAGALIEKIDLQTGELVWQISNDLRVSPYREKVLSVKAVDDVLVVSGIREDITNELSLQLAEVAFVAKSKGKVFERVYDLETGQQISYDTPSQEDSLAYNFSFTPWVYYNFFDDEKENFLDAKNFAVGKGTYLIRRKIDDLGRLVAGPDTLVTGRFNDRFLTDGIFTSGPRLREKEDGNFLYLEQYSPLEGIDLSFEAFISEYDKDFNLIRERNLKDFGIDKFSLIQILKTTTDYTLLRGCYNIGSQTVSTCNAFCLVLDQDLDLIDRFDLVDSEERQYSIIPSNITRGTNGAFFVQGSQFSLDNPTTIRILQTNSAGILEVFKRFEGININQRIAIEFMEILENGDFLMKLRHNCFENGSNIGAFQEWTRIKVNDLVSTLSEIDNKFDLKNIVSPNPFEDRLQIENSNMNISEVSIVNLDGRLIQTQKSGNEAKIILNTTNIEPGYYFVKVVTVNNESVSIGTVKF